MGRPVPTSHKVVRGILAGLILESGRAAAMKAERLLTRAEALCSLADEIDSAESHLALIRVSNCAFCLTRSSLAVVKFLIFSS